jgi:hypothetical protein
MVVPVEEYLRTSYRPDCDYVDGEVLDRNVGEHDHSDLNNECWSSRNDTLLSTQTH